MPTPQFRIRTLLISIAFLALVLTVAIQTIRLQRTAARLQRTAASEQMLRTAAERLRADAEQARIFAEIDARRAARRTQAALDELSPQLDPSREKREP